MIFQFVMSSNPRAFVMTASDVRRRLHKGVKDGVASYWLQPLSYEGFAGQWATIGKGLR